MDTNSICFIVLLIVIFYSLCMVEQEKKQTEKSEAMEVKWKPLYLPLPTPSQPPQPTNQTTNPAPRAKPALPVLQTFGLTTV